MEKAKCPHCDAELVTVETPILSDWYGAELEMCLNDMCEYFLKSFKVIFSQSGLNMGYRYARNGGGGVLVGSIDTYKDCVLTDEERQRREDESAKKEKEYNDLCRAIFKAEDEAQMFADLGQEDRAEQQRQLAMWLRQLKKVRYPTATKKP